MLEKIMNVHSIQILSVDFTSIIIIDSEDFSAMVTEIN